MPRYLGPQKIGYCQRTGFKVPMKNLVRDGETGQLIEEGWEDHEHPQKYLPTLGTPPDRSLPTTARDPEDVTEVGSIFPDDDDLGS